MHVLIVEDDADVRQALTRGLERRGMTVAAAANGRQGLAAIAHHRFDAVLCDVVMPVMDGPGMYEALRARDPAQLDHLCFLTAYADDPAVVTFLRTTTRPVLAKPFELDHLIEVVESVASPPEPPPLEQVPAAPFSPAEVAHIRRQIVTPGRDLTCPRCGGSLETDLPLAGGGSMALVWEVTCGRCQRSVVVRDLPEPA